MAEIPEIRKYTRQMKDFLVGKTIAEVELLQEKCLNIPVVEFLERTKGASIVNVFHKGKWIFIKLDNHEHLLLSLGMGGDLLKFEPTEKLPEKYQVKTTFTDGTGYTVRFWWFGSYFLVPENELQHESKTKDIALDPLHEDFTLDYFQNLLSGKRTQVKSFLLNQKNVGGIGNMYMHDILFKAGLHPQKKISELDEMAIEKLYFSILEVLQLSLSKGTCEFEMDFFGEKGSYGMDDFLVGYRDQGEPCPSCKKTIISIKTGSTTSYICPSCQVL